MLSTTVLIHTLLAFSCVTAAAPQRYHMFPRVIVQHEHFEVLRMRASTEVDSRAVLETTCLDSKKKIVFHDENVALLSICGGIAGSTAKCGGAPTSTTGQSRTAKFELNPVQAGAKINISKGRWERCVRAARAVCPTGSLKAICSGGTSKGDLAFTLDNP